MRPILQIDVQKPPNETVEEWIGKALAQIVEGAREDAAFDAADAFTLDHTAYTELDTFDPNTATTAQVARALATLIKYIQQQGPRRS